MMNSQFSQGSYETEVSSSVTSSLETDPATEAPQDDLHNSPRNGVFTSTRTANLEKGSRQGNDLSELHEEVEKFSRIMGIDEKEMRRREELIQIIADTSFRLFKSKYRELKVHTFGSFANGLGTRKSDVDIVLIGIASPDSFGNQGFSSAAKNRVCQCLSQLKADLHIPLKKNELISAARIPILKLRTENDIDLDISLGNDSSPRTARFIKSKVEEFPALRPLVLVLKYILQSNSLNDVASGGLGSYALANMVIAFLTDRKERKKSMEDYGVLFLEFLHFFGRRFDYKKMAVSLRNGPFCSRREVLDRDTRSREDDYHAFKICVEDYFTGNNVSGGTSKTAEVKTLFCNTYDRLTNRHDAPLLKNRRSMFPLLSVLPEFRASVESRSQTQKRQRIMGNEVPFESQMLTLKSLPLPSDDSDEGERNQKKTKPESSSSAQLSATERVIEEDSLYDGCSENLTVSNIFATIFVPPGFLHAKENWNRPL